MSYDELFKLALRSFDNGDLTQAESLARQISQTAPDNPEILNLLGLIAQAKLQHTLACSYFSAAIRQKEDNAAFHYNLAFSLKASGQHADALANFTKVLRLAPTVKETHNEIACIYESLGQLDKARQHWQEALKLDASYITARTNLANSYKQDNPDKALSDLQNLAQQNSDEVLIWYDLAWLFYEQKKYHQALETAQQAQNLSPQADAIHYLLGLIYQELFDQSSAEKHFQQAEFLNGDNFAAKLCLANIFSRSGQFDQAETRYKRLIELNSKDFDTHNNYAELLYRQKRLTEALEEYRQAVIINPDSAEVCNNLGVVLKDLKEYEEALGLLFNALNKNPQLEAASVNLAETLILLAADNNSTAQKIAEQWQKEFPENPFASHINAALKGENVENNQIFIEKLFDNFADNYELVMQNLAYSAPLAIRRIAGPMEGRIADLGCGSGLVGMAVKTDRNQIIGIDLSAKMLENAARKKIYTELVKADITDFLRQRHDFDWIMAADVLCYQGSLDEFISLCRGKNIVFSIEQLATNENYQIQPSGRFKHNPIYIEKLLQQNGFCAISKEDIILRTENNLPVHGCIFKALKGTLLNGR